MNTIKGVKSAFVVLCAVLTTISASAEVWPDGSQMDAWFADRTPVDEAKLGTLRRAEEFGAHPDSGEMQTVALQRGIDAIAADGGGVLGNRLQSKEKTMGPRMNILEMMAERG